MLVASELSPDMSLTKLFKAPTKLFQKHVISFLIIRRHDLGLNHETLRYVAIRPHASISVLRQKIWHLLDLPDYCDEVIILKSNDGIEIPLTELKNGNTPERPFILEVWFPNKDNYFKMLPKNMILAKEQSYNEMTATTEKKENPENGTFGAHEGKPVPAKPLTREKIELTKTMYNKPSKNLLHQQSQLSCCISNTSLFKLKKKKSKDNFAMLLLKIQNDLTCLNTKLAVLENKIPTL